MPLLLNRNDVQTVLQMNECIDAHEKAFTEMANGTAVLPLRTGISPPDGLSLYMPAYLQEMNALACKVVTVFKNNPADHKLPVVIGTVLLQDASTGQVTCIMDGGYLTAVRTGAVSGLATRYLAREDEGQVVTIYGAGVQAIMQLWAVCEVRNISRAMVCDVVPEAAYSFANEMSDRLGIPVEVQDEEDALLEADIICAATTSPEPIFDGSCVKEGTHINGIGSHSPGAREMDSEIVRRSLLIADSYEACLNEAGDIMIPISEGVIGEDHIHAELAEIVAGTKAGRATSEQITLFKSNGLAIQDAATAKIVYERAQEQGIGTEIDL
ncbi:ornithine cyclodeaminase family protein [Candidatus Zixiibacteriota bacterium]